MKILTTLGKVRKVRRHLRPRRSKIKGIYNPEKQAFARGMKEKPTEAEVALWEMLKGRKLCTRFRRQHQIRGWIVDFYSPSWKLVIEVDGEIHRGRRKEDGIRDMVMRNAGLKVVRILNSIVMTDPDLAIRMILAALR